jgi:glycogen synthase
MLGWEYPPILAGGLGTACYGLVNALKEYAAVTLLLPTYSQAYLDEKLKIVGFNTEEKQWLESNRLVYETVEIEEKVRRIRVEVGMDFDPYPVGIGFEMDIRELEARAVERITDSEPSLFDTEEPYGSQIVEKVHRFRQMALDIVLGQENGVDFDIIHAHDWITFPAAIALQEATGKPLVLHIHSLETDRVGESRDFSLNAIYEIERRAMLAADAVIPVSEYTKGCIVRNYGVPEVKLHPVYNAATPVASYRIERKGDEKIVVFLGRVTFQKGPEFMVETATKLTAKFKKVRFVVAGVGDRLEQLRLMTKARGIDGYFDFVGFLPRPAVADLLAQADVYFMPSISEPFGLSALEAAQFDVPCIVSTQSGVSEVLPNALQADFWDTDRFANYLFALLNYEGIRKTIVELTSEDIAELTWDESARDVMGVYEVVLQSR